MKVLLVGNIYGNDYAANFYMIMQKFVHGFVRNGHAVHVFNDREVARGTNIFRARKLGMYTANRRLIDACRNFRPDLLFLGHCEMIENETLAQIRQDIPEVRIVYRNVDLPTDKSNLKRIHRRAPAVDVVFMTTAGETLRQFDYPGVAVHYVPNPIDPSVETLRNFQHTDQRFDLFFASGSTPRAGDPRAALIQVLSERLQDFAIEVRGWSKPAVRGANYFDLLADSRMGLSLSRVNCYYLYSSDRMAQYMGNGLLTFVKRSSGFGDLYREGEIAFFDESDELVDKLNFYKLNDNARQRAAEAGWCKSHGMFEVSRVARYVEEVAFQRPFSRTYEWPTYNHVG